MTSENHSTSPATMAEDQANAETSYTFSEHSDYSSTGSASSISHGGDAFSEEAFYIKTMLGHLARITTAIRRSGAAMRYQKADLSLMKRDYSELEDHLSFVIRLANANNAAAHLDLSKTGEGNTTASVRLTAVQQRLISVNITRRNRIIFATRNMRFKEPTGAQYQGREISALPQVPRAQVELSHGSISKTAVSVSNPHRSTNSAKEMSVSKTATEMGSNFRLPETTALGQETHSIVTRVTDIGATQDYPSFPSHQNMNWVQCPYCAEMLPANYANKPSRWR